MASSRSMTAESPRPRGVACLRRAPASPRQIPLAVALSRCSPGVSEQRRGWPMIDGHPRWVIALFPPDVPSPGAFQCDVEGAADVH
uniref:Uncharacterized protein n=1 Tax=Steinernema glaseri TaxID=37863 RepID=A0A1I7YIQ9_9BILA